MSLSWVLNPTTENAEPRSYYSNIQSFGDRKTICVHSFVKDRRLYRLAASESVITAGHKAAHGSSKSTYLKKEVLQFQMSFGHVSRRGVWPLHLKTQKMTCSITKQKQTGQQAGDRCINKTSWCWRVKRAEQRRESTNKCHLFAYNTSVQTTKQPMENHRVVTCCGYEALHWSPTSHHSAPFWRETLDPDIHVDADLHKPSTNQPIPHGTGHTLKSSPPPHVTLQKLFRNSDKELKVSAWPPNAPEPNLTSLHGMFQ